MKYRFLINYTECADREETKKKKTKGCEEKDDYKVKYHFLISQTACLVRAKKEGKRSIISPC